MARRFMEFREIKEVSEFNSSKSQNNQDKDVNVDLDEVFDYEDCRKQVDLDEISEELEKEDYSDCAKEIALEDVVMDKNVDLDSIAQLDQSVMLDAMDIEVDDYNWDDCSRTIE